MPFLAAFGTLLFLLLMQFLIRYLPDLVGRGLPFWVMAELVAYSLAYMVTLAVPMAWLIALLAAFGRLSESRAYLVIKSAGISLRRLAWPVFAVGFLLTLGMGYFNNVMLPEANHRLNTLWRDVRVSRPGFALEPGVFYTGLDGYAIRAATIPPDSSGLLLGVTVFHDDHSGGDALLTAERARLQTQGGGQRLTMLLQNGEVHVREPGRTDRYRQLRFRQHRLALDLSDLTFERRDDREGPRTDRTMRTTDMIAVVDSLERVAAARDDSVRARAIRAGRAQGRRVPRNRDDVRSRDDPPPPPELTASLDSAPSEDASSDDATQPPLLRSQPPRDEPPSPPPTGSADTTRADSRYAALHGLSASAAAAVADLALNRTRDLKREAESAASATDWERQRADRYRVEIYKKNSIALACLVFVLIGVPLGLSISRAGVGLVAALAVGIFLFYWITLVQGEKLADRGLLPPWLGMWAANVIVGALGVYLFARESRDPAWRDPVRALAGRFRSSHR